ncbi:MAG TPA: glycosyltransferase family 4 protein [Acidimicrobiia bacterium]|nr:glycosyltransferase family 4 protein [Acidimicrobiia bacterium]
MSIRIVALGSTTRRNRIGRTYSLWLTARAANIPFLYIGVDDGPIWEPLRDNEAFLADVRTAADVADLERQVARELDPDTVLLVCKPRPEILRVALRLERFAPVLVDVDDPELLDPWIDNSLLLRVKRVLRTGPSKFRFGWARRVVAKMDVIASSPSLQERYGGIVVPHVREDDALPRARDGSERQFRVGFVGTPRNHKGVPQLRAAVALLAQQRDVRLCITAPRPEDAQPWEEWVGYTTMEGGRRVLAESDAVAIVSQPGIWGELQFPVKLVDAMLAEVPVVITPRGPLLWAMGGTGVVVSDGSVDEIVSALTRLADDPAFARELAVAARQRALGMFTPAAVAPHFREAVERVYIKRTRT